MVSPSEHVKTLPLIGVGVTAAEGSKSHVVNRRTGKTLCGRNPLSIYGIDLHAKDQITCGRCYKLAFHGVNKCAPGVPPDLKSYQATISGHVPQ